MIRAFWHVFNTSAHVGLGFWTGWTINEEEFRTGGLVIAGTFVTYQAMQIVTKGDKGYNEIREFMIGMGIALGARRLRHWLNR